MIATISNWQDVILDERTELKISPVGKFYLEKLICEFEYLYQMALSSLMSKTYVAEITSNVRVDKESGANEVIGWGKREI